jgi:hypothetical protein
MSRSLHIDGHSHWNVLTVHTQSAVKECRHNNASSTLYLEPPRRVANTIPLKQHCQQKP